MTCWTRICRGLTSSSSHAIWLEPFEELCHVFLVICVNNYVIYNVFAIGNSLQDLLYDALKYFWSRCDSVIWTFIPIKAFVTYKGRDVATWFAKLYLVKCFSEVQSCKHTGPIHLLQSFLNIRHWESFSHDCIVSLSHVYCKPDFVVWFRYCYDIGYSWSWSYYFLNYVIFLKLYNFVFD